MHYILGLDIGITSIGWAVIESDQDGVPFKIADLGVRIFKAAEQPKTGASLALPRRSARSLRRRLWRKAHRKERIKLLLDRVGLITKENLEKLFSASSFEKDVYTLRSEGLDRKLNNEEWARVLYHLAQRRGYRSSSKAEEADTKNDAGKLLKAVRNNSDKMAQNNFRTVGEMFCKDSSDLFQVKDGSGHVIGRKTHNTSGVYDLTVARTFIEEEAHKLFAAQRQFGNAFATESIENEYCEILLSQRHFSDGPGGERTFKFDLRGNCTFEKDELRAFKACYTFEFFKLLQDINHLRIIPEYRKGSNKQTRPLTPEERQKIIDLCLKSPDVKFSKLRKELKLADDELFNRVNYDIKKKKSKKKDAEEQPEEQLTPEQQRTKCEEATKFTQMQSYHEMRKALDKVAKGTISKFSHDKLDEIGEILSLYKADDKRRERLEQIGLSNEEIEALLPLTFTKAGNLSLGAMRKLIPYLEQGLTYDKACEIVYGDHRAQYKGERMPLLSFGKLKEEGALDSVNNPVVLRAIAQTFKVVNAIIRRYGSPQAIHIELARDMKRNFTDRQDIKKQQDSNWSYNDRIREKVEELKGSAATGQDIVKMKLYEEQDGYCLYSGKKLDIRRLFEVGYAEVDHIVPYSKCFDDSYNNKVLVFSSENQRKGNRLPLEYMLAEGDEDKLDDYVTLVEARIKNTRKKQRLLKPCLTAEDSNDWKERNLTDTQYITKAVADILRNYLAFEEDSPFIKKPVRSINGAVTDQVRKRLGLQKHREEGDLHHAMDAAVIAITTDSYINKISRYTQRREFGKRIGCYKDKQTGEKVEIEKQKGQAPLYVDPETGEKLTEQAFDQKYAPTFPAPWDRFTEELKARMAPNADEAIRQLYLPSYGSEEIKPIFVSQMPDRKISGQAHAETIRSARIDVDESGKERIIAVAKTPLTSLKLDKDGEIDGYYMPSSDRLLYEELKNRLKAYGNAEQAFKEPVYKPKKDGSQGPRVYKVKTWKPTTSNVKVAGGIADNGSMVRIDVFHIKEGKDKGYYFIPIYVADTIKKELPQKAVVQGEPMDNWKEMDDKDFIFSLYPGDLVKVESPKKSGLKLKTPDKKREKCEKKWFLYYVSAGISTGTICVTSHDRKYLQESMGIKTLKIIEKYEVDVLGNYHKVRLPEKRQAFNLKYSQKKQ